MCLTSQHEWFCNKRLQRRNVSILPFYPTRNSLTGSWTKASCFQDIRPYRIYRQTAWLVWLTHCITQFALLVRYRCGWIWNSGRLQLWVTPCFYRIHSGCRCGGSSSGKTSTSRGTFSLYKELLVVFERRWLILRNLLARSYYSYFLMIIKLIE